MYKPDISGLIVVASGKYGSVALRYMVDTDSNRVTYIIKRSRVSDLVYEDYAMARKFFDEVCAACGY